MADIRHLAPQIKEQLTGQFYKLSLIVLYIYLFI